MLSRDRHARALKRMRTPRLAEAAHQRFVVGFEKQQPRIDAAPDLPEDSRELPQSRPFAHIDHQRRAPDRGGIAHQFGKLRDQFDRKIIDGVIAEIFQRAQHRTLARAAHSGDDHQFRAACDCGLAAGFRPALRRFHSAVSSRGCRPSFRGTRLLSRHFSRTLIACFSSFPTAA